MARIQSKRDDNTLRSAQDQYNTWDNLEKLTKNKLNKTSNEFKCDCPSCSSSEVVRKKVFTKNLPKRSRVLSRNHKNNKFTTTTQTRRKLCTGYDHSYEDVIYPSLCDRPRVLEKSVKTTNITENLDTTEVRSIEVIKSIPKNCCSALYSKSKPILAKISNKLESSRDKKYLISSSSSLSSPVDQSGNVTSEITSIDDETNNKKTKNNEIKLEERFSNSLENDLKHLDEQTYQRVTARGNRSHEVSHKRQELFPSDFENRETIHKVKTHKMEKLPYESSYSKLDKILQNPETDGLLTCMCDKTKVINNCPIFYNCPENSSHQDDGKNSSLSGEHDQQNEKSLSSFNDDDDKLEELTIPSKKSDDNSFDKSYSPSVNLEARSPKLWQKLEQNFENISANYREISSGLKEMRKEVVENEKPIKEFEREKIIREFPIKKFTFETQTVDNDLDNMKSINKPSTRNNIDTSYSTSSQGSQNITKALDREKSPITNQEKIDPTDDVINQTDKLTINNQDKGSSQLRTTLENCKFEFCKCDFLHDNEEAVGKSTSPIVKNYSISSEPSKERIKRHDFSLPKIVVPESSERSDVRKMFVYPSEENCEPPLTVYRTSSFVKCEIRENKNIGFRYVLTYVQKYVSPTWKPNEHNKRKATSQEHVKTDDYG